MPEEWRVFAGWDNGSFVNSLSPEFHQKLNELIRDFGPCQDFITAREKERKPNDKRKGKTN